MSPLSPKDLGFLGNLSLTGGMRLSFHAPPFAVNNDSNSYHINNNNGQENGNYYNGLYWGYTGIIPR